MRRRSGQHPYDVLNRMANGHEQPRTTCGAATQFLLDLARLPTAGQDQIFQQFAAQGQSFFQASGD